MTVGSVRMEATHRKCRTARQVVWMQKALALILVSVSSRVFTKWKKYYNADLFMEFICFRYLCKALPWSRVWLYNPSFHFRFLWREKWSEAQHHSGNDKVLTCGNKIGENCPCKLFSLTEQFVECKYYHNAFDYIIILGSFNEIVFELFCFNTLNKV